MLSTTGDADRVVLLCALQSKRTYLQYYARQYTAIHNSLMQCHTTFFEGAKMLLKCAAARYSPHNWHFACKSTRHLESLAQTPSASPQTLFSTRTHAPITTHLVPPRYLRHYAFIHAPSSLLVVPANECMATTHKEHTTSWWAAPHHARPGSPATHALRKRLL